MSIEQHEHARDPEATSSAPTVEVLSTVPAPPQIPDDAEVMTVLVTLPPGSAGAPPHRHTGPAFGYVIKGEVIFEVEGRPQQIIKAGGTFSEPGGDVIHYRDGNNLSMEESAFVATLFGAAGQPMFVPVGEDELEARRDRRVTRP